MAIRAEFAGSCLLRRLAVALLACSPLLANAQDCVLRPQDRVSGAQIFAPVATFASAPLTNLPGRERRSLNGKWQALVDGYADGISGWKAVWKDQAATGKAQFFEYGFDDSVTLDVPGDFNTQQPELTWLEGSVWYRKAFEYAAAARREGLRLFVHFGAANYRADVFLNGEKLGSHEGGFTPFQFELTERVKPGENRLLVHVNNERRKDGIPAQDFDWFNYGGLTRDVDLVETPGTYIQAYSLFGAEARYGHHGRDDMPSAWNEEFQAEFYRKQLRMLARILSLRGTAPWVLMDFRSPVRMHPFQAGYNRKGLLSERGERKLAWRVMQDYYREISR
jgi:beta-glucuronidase